MNNSSTVMVNGSEMMGMNGKMSKIKMANNEVRIKLIRILFNAPRKLVAFLQVENTIKYPDRLY